MQEVSSGEQLCSDIENFKFRKKGSEIKSEIEKNCLRKIARDSRTEEQFRSPRSTNLKLRKNIATTYDNSLGISPQRGKFKKQKIENKSLETNPRKIKNLIAKFEENLKSSGNSSQSKESGLIEGTFQPKPKSTTFNPKIRPKQTSSQSEMMSQTGPRQAHRTIQMLSHNWLQNPTE